MTLILVKRNNHKSKSSPLNWCYAIHLKLKFKLKKVQILNWIFYEVYYYIVFVLHIWYRYCVWILWTMTVKCVIFDVLFKCVYKIVLQLDEKKTSIWNGLVIILFFNWEWEWKTSEKICVCFLEFLRRVKQPFWVSCCMIFRLSKIRTFNLFRRDF